MKGTYMNDSDRQALDMYKRDGYTIVDSEAEADITVNTEDGPVYLKKS